MKIVENLSHTDNLKVYRVKGSNAKLITVIEVSGNWNTGCPAAPKAFHIALAIAFGYNTDYVVDFSRANSIHPDMVESLRRFHTVITTELATTSTPQLLFVGLAGSKESVIERFLISSINPTHSCLTLQHAMERL
ncbi:MAG: hypothetical protein V1712_01350 [Patescibacteria group bacterium]